MKEKFKFLKNPFFMVLLFCLIFTLINAIITISYKDLISIYSKSNIIRNIDKNIKQNLLLTLDLNDYNWGYIDKSGKFTIKPVFEGSSPFREGIASVKIGDKWGAIDKSGKVVVKPIYSGSFSFSHDRASADKGELTNLDTFEQHIIDKNGKVLFIGKLKGTALSGIKDDNEGLFLFSRDHKYGALDNYGRVVIPPKFDYLSEFRNGMSHYGVTIKTKGATDSGSSLTEPLLDKNFSGGMKVVILDNKTRIWDMGIIDAKGKIITGPVFEEVSHFSGDLAAVIVKNKKGFINKQGKFVIKPVYVHKNEFFYDSEGFFAVHQGGKYGFVGDSGKTIIKPQYDNVKPFSEDLAAVQIDEKWGYINKKGQMVIKPQFNYADKFNSGIAVISINDKFGAIDKQGNITIPAQFTDKLIFREGLAVMKKNEKYGYINSKGQFVIKPQFEFAQNFSEGLAVVGLKK